MKKRGSLFVICQKGGQKFSHKILQTRGFCEKILPQNLTFDAKSKSTTLTNETHRQIFNNDHNEKTPKMTNEKVKQQITIHNHVIY